MTSFMVFDKSTVELSVYIDGKEKTSQIYAYEVGEMDGTDRRTINISGNEGSWSLKADGSLYMHNQGQLYIYSPFGEKRMITDADEKPLKDTAKSQSATQVNQQAEEMPNLNGTFTDKRDGKSYRWVKIGKQYWMAENLAYRTPTGSFCYKTNTADSLRYGRFYDLTAASKAACPDGWHIASDDEWKELLNTCTGQNGDSQDENERRVKSLIKNGFLDSTSLVAGFGIYLYSPDGNSPFKWQYIPFQNADAEYKMHPYKYSTPVRWWSSTEEGKQQLPSHLIFDEENKYGFRHYYDLGSPNVRYMNGYNNAYLPSQFEAPVYCYPIRCVQD